MYRMTGTTNPTACSAGSSTTWSPWSSFSSSTAPLSKLFGLTNTLSVNKPRKWMWKVCDQTQTNLLRPPKWGLLKLPWPMSHFGLPSGLHMLLFSSWPLLEARVALLHSCLRFPAFALSWHLAWTLLFMLWATLSTVKLWPRRCLAWVSFLFRFFLVFHSFFYLSQALKRPLMITPPNRRLSRLRRLKLFSVMQISVIFWLPFLSFLFKRGNERWKTF